MDIRGNIFTMAMAVLMLLPVSCRRQHSEVNYGSAPRFLDISVRPEGGWNVVSISPFDGSCDTLVVDHSMDRLVVMSTSYIGFLDAIGCDSVICGISGCEYVCDSNIVTRVADGTVAEVGYEASPDYEKIVSLHPDLLLTYSVSGTKSRFVTKLESLGIRVFTVNEHLESDPLARAAYVCLFGALTGRMDAADSVLRSVTAAYESLCADVPDDVRKVLVNIPYNDQWFIPGGDSYLTRLVSAAGGEILGTEAGQSNSSVISLEAAYSLSKEASCWLNVGWCTTMEQLMGENPIFENILGNVKANAAATGHADSVVVWNNNLRLNPNGGNDFWESGVVRPDLVLEDLISILHPQASKSAGHYYRPIL